MSWRVLVSGIGLSLLATSSDGARLRQSGEDLLRVVMPISRAIATAHPHVNVVVAFGTAQDGTPVDPSTFRAKLNGRDVTAAFAPVIADGVTTGVHTALPESALRLVGTPRNRLRLSVVGERVSGAKGPRPRDVDRLRFGAADGQNQPPVVMLASDRDTAVLGTAVGFDAAGSHDPDADELTFSWTFSDGGTAEGTAVTHTFAQASGGTVAATVSVSDGVTTVPVTRTMPIAITPDPGRTPGQLRVEGPALEFSAVAVGTSATRVLTLRNADPTATSQLKVDATALGAGAFTLEPTTLDLGPDGSATIVVTFAPTGPGHSSAEIRLVTSAANRPTLALLAHGYGGTAPGDGPTLVDVPVFAAPGVELTRIAPDGTHTIVDATTGLCTGGDVCLASDECPTSAETCSAATTPIDVSELCSDGQSVFVLSEDSYTDPRLEPDTELSGTLTRFDLDATGAVTGREVLYRTTEDTAHLACDQIGTGIGGLAYLAEFRNVADTANCPRDERDALVSVNKATGNARTVSGFSRIDQAAGVAECDFRDAVSALAVSADGVTRYAGFDAHGLWRIGPTPLAFTPDVHDGFGVHPDGGLAFAVAHDRGTTGSVDLYRLTANQVEHGALRLDSLTPCASFTVANDDTNTARARTAATSLVIGPASGDAAAATALVTFRTGPQSIDVDVLPPTGDLRGTVAFALPAGSTACSLAGLVSLAGTALAR